MQFPDGIMCYPPILTIQHPLEKLCHGLLRFLMPRRACALSEREKYGLTRISIKKLLHNNKTNIVESSPLFLMSNFWCRQGEEILNLYRVNAVASYTLLSHGWQQRCLLPLPALFTRSTGGIPSRLLPFNFPEGILHIKYMRIKNGIRSYFGMIEFRYFSHSNTLHHSL